jgi:hypothetical protein
VSVVVGRRSWTGCVVAGLSCGHNGWHVGWHAGWFAVWDHNELIDGWVPMSGGGSNFCRRKGSKLKLRVQLLA